MEKRKPILKDVTLCTIVRDEEINPAGGIKKFIESIVPYVDEAKILDTGSKDRTKEILEELQKKYSQLEIFENGFTGYASARNNLLDKVPNGRRVLILDADELVSDKYQSLKGGFEELAKFIKNNPALAYNIHMKNFYSDELDENRWIVDRLFTKSDEIEYTNTKYLGKEFVFVNGLRQRDLDTTLTIPEDIVHLVHFCPDREAVKNKKIKLYKGLRQGLAPSETEYYNDREPLNPQRKNYS